MRRRISWRLKLPLLLVVFAAVPLIVASYLMHQVLTRSYVTSTFDSLETIVQSQSAAVEQFSEDRQNEVQRIAQLIAKPTEEVISAALLVRSKEKAPEPLPALVDAEELPKVKPKKPPSDKEAEVEEVPPAPPIASPEARLEEAKTELRRRLGLVLWDQTKFEEFLVMGVSGEVLVSTFQMHEGRTAEGLEYFLNGIGATYVQPVFNSPITNRLTMVISTPIRNENAEVVAVLAARLNMSRFFSLITNAAGLGLSGETVVGKLINNEIVLMAPTRHTPDAALHTSFSAKSSFGQAMQRAAMGQQASERVQDYRGQCVFASWKPLTSLNWAMAVKLDCSEALAPVKQAYDDLIRLLLVVTLLALLGALLTAHRLVAPVNALRDAADSISRGNFDVHLPVAPEDEIGDLADSFERMISAIRFFRAQSLGQDVEAQLDEEAENTETPSPGKTGPSSRDAGTGQDRNETSSFSDDE